MAHSNREGAMTQAAVGRPREAGYDRRILEAAVRVFACRGWERFTFDAVASEAGVGKPALYRRWTSRIELLQAATTELVDQTIVDHGSLRADLQGYIRRFFNFMMTDSGRAWLRLQVELPFHEDLQVISRMELLGPAQAEFEGIISRAIARGEITRAPSLKFMLEAIGGPVAMRTIHTRPSEHDRLTAQEERYVENLSNWTLRALTEA
ncbi:TetR/AcrR family transcriptional regulator [Rhodococcus qingshengii]|uniref:TetR/AcrR family transcriptional regulator n=1 Tax=Rhodococcus qingshengii TaxID=334542 RepID=UPI0010A631E4|nr:TetR/AcrR family transcriptional regulator [Rhodococcus qingshengii]THJ67614.1 TetR/AcrR family transcriptional regulator [Rhodococcus qingshengii]